VGPSSGTVLAVSHAGRRCCNVMNFASEKSSLWIIAYSDSKLRYFFQEHPGTHSPQNKILFGTIPHNKNKKHLPFSTMNPEHFKPQDENGWRGRSTDVLSWDVYLTTSGETRRSLSRLRCFRWLGFSDGDIYVKTVNNYKSVLSLGQVGLVA